jgi:hypothetical protein
MIVLATATFTDPSKIGPYVDEEVAGLHGFRDRGLIQALFIRADGTGAVVLWNVASIEEARRHIGELSFSKRGLMTIELTELNPL